MISKTTPIEIRFWAKVQKSDNCWLWTACKTAAGYGVISRGGKYGGIMLAHRLSYEMEYGSIPRGLDVCHHCDNPWCVRPDHLFLGTERDNLRDAARKGRTSRGEGRPLSRLNEEAVKVVRWARRKGISQALLGALYRADRRTIGDVGRGKRWAYLQYPAHDEPASKSFFKRLNAEAVKVIRVCGSSGISFALLSRLYKVTPPVISYHARKSLSVG